MSSSDDKAFEILVRQHHRRLLSYAFALVPRHDVAEDLVQDAFVSAYGALATFDPSRDFGAWMRGIVRNKYREWVRSRRDVPLDQATLDAIEDQHRTWDEIEQERSLLQALEQCLQRLPEALLHVVDLFYLKQLPGAQVATRVASSAATVRKRLQRAREQLAVCIGQRLKCTCPGAETNPD